MNKTPRLSKSRIEYLDYMWGIWSGCRNLERGICPVSECWAKGLTTRFPNIYPNGFYPTFYPEAIESPKYIKKPSRIGVGWVGDVIGYVDEIDHRYEGISPKYRIITTIKQCPQHTFLFLTKNPENLPRWSSVPDNCWMGVTVTNNTLWNRAIKNLANVQSVIKFISFEPLLSFVGNTTDRENDPNDLADEFLRCGINWLIIGAQTNPTVYPKIEWMREIVEAADKAGVPMFLKDNLRPLIATLSATEALPFYDSQSYELRQEFPK